MLHQGNYFAVSGKLNFCKRQTYCIYDQDEVQSVTDTANEFNECQNQGKRWNQLTLHISAYTHL